MKDFFQLNPDSILDAVEKAIQIDEPEVRATGRALSLNSMENRVFDVELDDESHVVAKFYRPGRWTREQIQEEHDFLFTLEEAEIPVIVPLGIGDQSVFTMANGIFFALFPKVRGRLMDELDEDRLRTVGRYIGRIHNVGEHFHFQHRLKMSVEEWGRKSLSFLQTSKFLPPEYAPRYKMLAEQIFMILEPFLNSAPTLSLHGDCHLGNTLWQQDSPFFLDFDDSITAPAVQDIWMVVRGRDNEAIKQRNLLLEGYEAFRPFDRRSLRYLEPLRALRMIQYSAWIGRRWDDPFFPKIFPHYGSTKYWEEEMHALQESLAIFQDNDHLST
jgi:Ser/Thr protein kinase RdoA (MazF antagonist)